MSLGKARFRLLHTCLHKQIESSFVKHQNTLLILCMQRQDDHNKNLLQQYLSPCSPIVVNYVIDGKIRKMLKQRLIAEHRACLRQKFSWNQYVHSDGKKSSCLQNLCYS